MRDAEPKRMTRQAWEAKHPDFKTVDEGGQHWALHLDEETGATVLLPVEIIENEEGR